MLAPAFDLPVAHRLMAGAQEHLVERSVIAPLVRAQQPAAFRPLASGHCATDHLHRPSFMQIRKSGLQIGADHCARRIIIRPIPSVEPGLECLAVLRRRQV